MASDKKQIACAIYTRKSSEEGLEQEFNSLNAQREACEAYILSQCHEGWRALDAHYDDGGFSGGNTDRPGLQKLLEDVRERKVDVIVVYKVDRLTRSLSDFAKIVDVFDAQGVSFVSVTQQFNTTTSMGRLTLNVLLSFAQFEREVTGERIRDKIAASKKKGMWMGGLIPIGYDLKDQKLQINDIEAETVRTIFRLYRQCRSVPQLQVDLARRGILTKSYTNKNGREIGGRQFSRGHLYRLLNNRLYLGEVEHKGQIYQGQHDGIVDPDLWKSVQATMANNTKDRLSAKGVKHPSPLAGLLYDDRGNRLSPTHTQRGSIRRRYYVCRAIVLKQPEKVGATRRISASEIETLVEHQVGRLFKHPAQLLDHLSADTASPESRHALLTGAEALGSLLERKDGIGMSFIRSIIRKIVVAPEKVIITFDRRAIVDALGVNTENERARGLERADVANDEFMIEVPARLKRCGRQKRILITDRNDGGELSQINESLVRALNQAFKWEQKVRAGHSMEAIAKEEKIGRTYVSRVVKLAFLAPDIVETIIDGRQPQDLKIKTLFRDLPMDWVEQRRMLGFPAQ
jgi:site-specific DNA recombinase